MNGEGLVYVMHNCLGLTESLPSLQHVACKVLLETQHSGACMVGFYGPEQEAAPHFCSHSTDLNSVMWVHLGARAAGRSG